jgi:hypothetical protein
MPPERLVVDPSVDQEIRAVLAAYLRDPSLIGAVLENNDGLPVLARIFDALPVYADMGGALLVHPSGDVLFVHSNQVWDALAEFEVERSEKWVGEAYRSCARRFPSLGEAVRRLAVASNKSLERTREG